MREIKFRAWDKLRKRFLYPAEIHPSILISYRQYPESEEVKVEHGQMTIPLVPISHEGMSLKEGGDAEINLFTGLKDKNGKEIYEGDIVKSGEFLYEVYFGKTSFCLKGKGRTGRTIYFPTWQGEKVEVIGNIYENPELLKCRRNPKS